ncbi:hypothetical protein NXG27_04200 [Megasphaera paucivorans]|uniref:Uncharacterized protein n=1 Tax=Megasphaera paucivorans TaxID=349095 RepID=A0A1G9QT25_9FIRM|nr:hypothetical protein [Megasphaera paucivorans]SDM14172.1 hypothetical protein SAMN05660299_00272 [Megasphaera paucivorans]
MEEKTVISKQELAKRWGCSTKAIEEREHVGLIKRRHGLPNVMYRMREVYELEGLDEKDRHTISPFEYHQAIVRAENAEQKVKELRSKMAQVAVVINGEMLKQADREVNEG